MSATIVTHESAFDSKADVVSSTSAAGSRIPELDGLRGLAIAFVVMFHCFYFHPSASYNRTGVLRHIVLYFERPLVQKRHTFKY
jgi:uncharacterized membrane protein